MMPRYSIRNSGEGELPYNVGDFEGFDPDELIEFAKLAKQANTTIRLVENRAMMRWDLYFKGDVIGYD